MGGWHVKTPFSRELAAQIVPHVQGFFLGEVLLVQSLFDHVNDLQQ